MPRIPPRMTRNARAQRNTPTDAQRAIWSRLSQFRPRFTRELSVGRYILDLACREAKLAVELDGSQHLDSAYDAERTAFLEGLGWRVVRYWNTQALTNPDGVAEAILAHVRDILGPDSVQPAPARAGRPRRPRTRPPK